MSIFANKSLSLSALFPLIARRTVVHVATDYRKYILSDDTLPHQAAGCHPELFAFGVGWKRLRSKPILMFAPDVFRSTDCAEDIIASAPMASALDTVPFSLILSLMFTQTRPHCSARMHTPRVRDTVTFTVTVDLRQRRHAC
jgi:hypothetical protein